MCTHRSYSMMTFLSVDMLSFHVSVLCFRRVVKVSTLVIKVINIGFELIKLLNNKDFIILSRVPWGNIIILN